MHAIKNIPKGARIRGGLTKSWYTVESSCGSVPCDKEQTHFPPIQGLQVLLYGLLKSERTGKLLVVKHEEPWLIYEVDDKATASASATK